MQEPRCPMGESGQTVRDEGQHGSGHAGPPPSSIPPRRRRQERTVYSAEQRQELEAAFGRNQYPTYQERESLASRLHLQEHQVQVWFKNRRAKDSRLLGRSRRQVPEARAAPQSPEACAPAPAHANPVPAPVNPGFPRGLAFFGSQGFHNSTPIGPFGTRPAAEPISSHSQVWWDPAQGAQKMVSAAPAPVPAQAPAPAPAPAPVWPQVSYASNFSLDPLAELSSLQDVLERPSTSGYQEGDDSANDNDSGPKTLLDL